jgi:hypothetical protein
VGLILGALITFFVFGGVPRSNKSPGEPIRPPDDASKASSARVVLSQDFFNGVLGTIFRDMNDPAFQLGAAERTEQFEHAAFQASPPCDGRITILPEGSGVTTGVRFENAKIMAPLAFSGSWASPVGCYQFTGWAQASMEMRFEASQQKLFGRINVETVNLDGVNPLISGFVTPIVQTTLNNRVNPIEILNGKQLALNMPIASTGGALRGDVTDMRAELKDGLLELYIVYTLAGGPAPN